MVWGCPLLGLQSRVRTRSYKGHFKGKADKLWNRNPFYPSARWARRGIVVPFVRRRRTHSFGYYTDMVQQKKFIIPINIQPLPALFFTKGQDHRSKVKAKD